ncbi:Asp-tRNA(Asn)/Glu-tRNA(Gln) amidotransferase subunit GatC [Candidatus Jorgensenbacteria bacterium]|nr:Asp-tRNA(Asn)/Glu-tRNA(Gln) amidotransferase subunit GatC [Candidatus Jorgensenbacteria bacterium]
MITKKDLENLAELARIELKKNEEEKLLADLEKILKHFEELKEVNTSSVKPMTGGTFLSNVLRDDASDNRVSNEKAIESFPNKEKGLLRVPPVFE